MTFSSKYSTSSLGPPWPPVKPLLLLLLADELLPVRKLRNGRACATDAGGTAAGSCRRNGRRSDRQGEGPRSLTDIAS